MKKSIVSTVLLCALTPLPAVFGQGMMGTTLHYSYMFPDGATEYPTGSGPADYLITSGVEVNEFGTLSVDVTDSQVILTMLIGTGWQGAAFNGIQWSDITNNLGAITSVTIDPATNYPGFDASRVVFTADSFGMNMQGLGIGNTVVLNIVTPTPGAAAVLSLGGLATMRRRRR